MSQKVQPALVGVFVVAAVFLALATAVLVGSGRFFAERSQLISFFDGEVSGLNPGSPVTYEGVVVGTVKEIRIALRDDPRALTDPRIPVIYELDLTRLNSLTREASLDLREDSARDRLIELGLRATLKSASLLTGTKTVELAFRPEVPDNRIAAGLLPYPEIPTTPNTLRELELEAEAFIAKVTALPVDSLVDNINGLVTDLRALIAAPESRETVTSVAEATEAFTTMAGAITELVEAVPEEVAPFREEVSATLDELRTVLSSIDTTLIHLRRQADPNAPISYRTQRVLEETEATVRSLRELIEYLNANPSALIRGRPGGGDTP